MKPIVSLYKQFVFERYAFNPLTGEAEFVYRMDDVMFTERVKFPAPAEGFAKGNTGALDRALFVLHLMAGISYYKAGLPKEIVVESGTLSKDEAVFWKKLYTNGLGEFFYRNDLDGRNYIHFPFSETQERVALPTKGKGVLVPIGGGKDSLVVVESFRAAGVPFDLLEVGDHPAIQRVVNAVQKDQETAFWKIQRTIDPALFDLNAKGGWNGHVPITAYVALLGVALAILHGKRDVVFSNERSANVGNVVVDGWEINHQYSKSLECERDLQKYIAESISPDIRYFSLLRPLSELAITKRFVENGKYLDMFSSCNKNFKIHEAKGERPWCGECPKCAFVFAMFAAFLPRDGVTRIFGKDLFMKADLIPMYQDLLGIGALKPFECVGEADEVTAAFTLARLRGDFNDTPVMKMFDEEVASRISAEEAQVMIMEALAPSANHAIPQDYLPVVL